MDIIFPVTKEPQDQYINKEDPSLSATMGSISPYYTSWPIPLCPQPGYFPYHPVLLETRSGPVLYPLGTQTSFSDTTTVPEIPKSSSENGKQNETETHEDSISSSTSHQEEN